MKKYKLIKTEITFEGNKIKSYGVGSNDVSVKNISTNKSYVKSIIKALNKNDVSEVHVKDVIEDYLALGGK